VKIVKCDTTQWLFVSVFFNVIGYNSVCMLIWY